MPSAAASRAVNTPRTPGCVLAFSVSFENDYVHVLRMLRLAGIPLRAADRGPGDPLVVMGGSCQRTWQHSVPKVRSAGPRISVQFRHAYPR